MATLVTPIILAVDPGAKGAIAFYCPDCVSMSNVHDIPASPLKLAALVQKLVAIGHPMKVVIELVHSRPHQAGAFNFGLSTGILHGIFAANGLEPALVPPSQWKPAMGLRRHVDESESDNKSRARALAAQLFPALADQFKRVKDDGRAEALLLAVYYHSKESK